MPDVGEPGGEEKISVAWDPPFAQWAPERVAEHAVIPRMNQPREVCNFDVALQFVKLEAKIQTIFPGQVPLRRIFSNCGGGFSYT